MRTLPTELIAFIAIAYVSILFFIAYRGDKKSKSGFYARHKTVIYSLSLAVYCSSWTFFGAVGSAARSGWDFFAIYLGPILVFVLGYKIIQRIIIISKQYSITSISDFLSSRYGKSRNIAVLVTFIAVIGSLPYISLQLHAISISFTTLTTPVNSAEYYRSAESLWSDTAFYGALILALFSILFGTRHLSATEHHRGMMNAIAFESIVKLIAILLVGLYATQLLFSQFDWHQLMRQPFELTSINTETSRFSWSDFTTKLLLSMGAIMLLPRQFQVTVVEADDHRQMETARWLLPLYLLLISLVVVPIALAGLMLLPGSSNADFFVLHLPQQNSEFSLAMIAFVGGISAGTGMVIVASISLSTMVCNDVVMPLLIRSRFIDIQQRPDLSQLILLIRRITIVFILLSSYGYFRLSGNNQQLANMGLLSFAAIIQFAPAMIAALYWQRANQRGVLLGLGIGFVTWAYCLLMPNFVSAETLNATFSQLAWLHPHHLLNISFHSSLTHGVVWSLLLNITALVVGSLHYAPSMLDKIQASIFTHTYVEPEALSQPVNFTANATVANAKVLCESIIGHANTEQLFDHHNKKAGKDRKARNIVDKTLIEDIERAIASVIGASSARHIITTQLLGEDVSAEDLFVMMDETSQALRFNQDILQASFENISQGISVVDKNLKLVAWNSRYQTMFDYPDDLLQIGTPIGKLIAYNAERGDCGPGDTISLIERRLNHLRNSGAYSSERKRRGAYIKINGNPIPGGGFVTSFTDITEQKNIEQALRNSESRIRLYTDNLPLMLCYIGRDEKVHFSNKAYNQFIGKTRDELQNVSVHTLFEHIDFEDREGHIRHALEGNRTEFHCHREDNAGRKTYYQVNYIPQITENGRVDGFFSIYQDITQSVEASDLLKKTNEQLEDRVAERTQDLESLNRQLKSLTKSKTRFLAAASHDLLQPINAARLFTNSLIDQPDSENGNDVKLLHKIDSSLVGADKLLRALLDISKLDTGTLSPEISHFEIEELMEDLRAELSPLAVNKGLNIKFMPCSSTVSSDKTLLRSIIQNLISNAIRYTSSGRVLIGCRRKGDALKIQVYDTGTGINEEDLPFIFNEFHRIQNPADNEKQGLGLGLAITKRLAEILDHPLEVQSRINWGSQFSISVPRHFGQVLSLPKSKAWQPSNNLAGVTVLYLENSPDSLDAMSALLNNWGCEVIMCATYEQAVDAIRQNLLSYDMILADYRLDESKTGLDFLDFASELDENITGVLVTAEQDLSIKNTALENSHIFLAKPVEPAALRGILTRLASLRKSRSA
jgi:PAS domain S-box-containing protein